MIKLLEINRIGIIPLFLDTNNGYVKINYNYKYSKFLFTLGKSGASSDDVISFYFGLPNYIELVCETN